MDAEHYAIVEIPPNSAERTEQLGTKFKFWYHDSNHGLCLFKEGRPGTGENWAEKVACELAGLIGLPHAQYELARFEDRLGAISVSLVASGARLIHGNELLASFGNDYGSTEKQYRSRDHTLRRVIGYFKASAETVGVPFQFAKTPSIRTALDVFVGYLMFDAWIANQDRHDQNWALLRASDGNSFLSSTFDHGSSMGRNESDEKRGLMLTTKDKGQSIETYVTRARSALYVNAATQENKALTTTAAFEAASGHAKDASKEWCRRLMTTSETAVCQILNRIPDEFITETSRSFTAKLLLLNKARVLEIGDSL